MCWYDRMIAAMMSSKWNNICTCSLIWNLCSPHFLRMALYVSICLHRCVSIRVLSWKTERHWWQGPSAEENGLNVRVFLLLTSLPSVLHQLNLRCDLMSNKTAGQREKGIVILVPCIKYTRIITRTLPLETRVASIRVRFHYSISH